MWGVLDRCFIGLNQVRQYDMSCHLDIGHNVPSADSPLTNRRYNARFSLRNRICETCDMAMYTSGGVRKRRVRMQTRSSMLWIGRPVSPARNVHLEKA